MVLFKTIVYFIVYNFFINKDTYICLVPLYFLLSGVSIKKKFVKVCSFLWMFEQSKLGMSFQVWCLRYKKDQSVFKDYGIREYKYRIS